jgi:hypothetical protein
MSDDPQQKNETLSPPHFQARFILEFDIDGTPD